MKDLLLVAVIAYPLALFFWKLRNLPFGHDDRDYFLATNSVPAAAFIDTTP